MCSCMHLVSTLSPRCFGNLRVLTQRSVSATPQEHQPSAWFHGACRQARKLQDMFKKLQNENEALRSGRIPPGNMGAGSGGGAGQRGVSPVGHGGAQMVRHGCCLAVCQRTSLIFMEKAALAKPDIASNFKSGSSVLLTHMLDH